jgi:hypothetical protein
MQQSTLATADSAPELGRQLRNESDLLQCNIVLITVDSCRFDTAVRASTPILDRIAVPRRAETYGSFTLPAHAAIFSGFLPNVREEPQWDFYSKERRQLWRMDRARQPARPRHLILLPGDDVVSGLKRHGYTAIGAGGVRWFSRGYLPSLFDEFHYWGPTGDASDKFAPRKAEDFALFHSGYLAERAVAAGRYFLFINAAETHAPYGGGDESADLDLDPVLRRWAANWNGAARLPTTQGCMTDMKLLHQAQIDALEAIDYRLGGLLDMLPPPLLVIVCGDHGEAFGEGRMWGHDFPAKEVMEVPLWMGLVGNLAC